ncbi:MAG: hypothetical protein ACUVQM_06815 [Candidatus Hadarchaeaceae archaeon]
MHEVVDLEEAVAFIQILDAPHGANLRYLRVIALDFVIAEQDDSLALGNQLPLKMGTDVPRAPAEDVYPTVVNGAIVAHHDVGRKACFFFAPHQSFLDCLHAPLGGVVAGDDVTLGVEDRYLIGPLPLSALPPLRRNALVGREFLIHVLNP